MKLIHGLKGTTYSQEDPEFVAQIQLFNQRIDRKPEMIVVPESKQDIVKIIEFAKKRGLKIGVKSGGHSACGYCVIPNGILIDMRKFKAIEIDPKKRIATAQAGVIVGELGDALSKHDLVSILGGCPSVGITGFALGGGIGLLSRRLGIMADRILEIEIITANQGLIKVNAFNYPELFWALRGSGICGFGVVISITFKLHSMSRKIYGGIVQWPLDKDRQVIKKYFDIMMSAPKELTLHCGIIHKQNMAPFTAILGFFIGDPTEGEKYFSSFLDIPKATAALSVKTCYQLQFMMYHQIEKKPFYLQRTGFLKNVDVDHFTDQIVKIYEQCPLSNGRITIDPMGGAINEVDKNKTSFIHRDNQFILSINGVWYKKKEELATMNWVNNSIEQLSDIFTGYVYQNYEDELLSNPALSYYGEHVKKIYDLIKKTDPDGLFGKYDDDFWKVKNTYSN